MRNLAAEIAVSFSKIILRKFRSTLGSRVKEGGLNKRGGRYKTGGGAEEVGNFDEIK